MIPTERLEEIRKLAAKAGGREWFTDPRPTNSGLARIDDGTSSMFAVKAEWPQANFIAAANPETVSSIITELLALRDRSSLLNVAERNAVATAISNWWMNDSTMPCDPTAEEIEQLTTVAIQAITASSEAHHDS